MVILAPSTQLAARQWKAIDGLFGSNRATASLLIVASCRVYCDDSLSNIYIWETCNIRGCRGKMHWHCEVKVSIMGVL